jgi:translation elongation factor P/translation initiation factor 5A
MSFHPMTVPASAVRTGNVIVLRNGRHATVTSRRNASRITVEITLDYFGERAETLPRDQTLTVWAYEGKPVQLNPQGLEIWPAPTKRSN